MQTTKVTSIEKYREVPPCQLRPHEKFEGLRLPISNEDDKNLEVSIQHYGIRDTLRVFRDNSDKDHFFLQDGHNVWQKAIKLKIPTLRIEICCFTSIDHAKLDYIDRKLARGHLTQQQRIDLALKQNEIEEKLARQRQNEGGTRSGLARSRRAKRNPDGTFGGSDQSVPQLTDTLVTRRGSLARLATQCGVSESTLQRVKAVKRADPELYHRILRGQVKSSAAYKTIQKQHENIEAALTAVERTAWKRLTQQESRQIKTLLETWKEMDTALLFITSDGAGELRELIMDLSREPRLLIHDARKHLGKIEASKYAKVTSHRTPTLRLVEVASR